MEIVASARSGGMSGEMCEDWGGCYIHSDRRVHAAHRASGGKQSGSVFSAEVCVPVADATFMLLAGNKRKLLTLAFVSTLEPRTKLMVST